MRTTLTIDDDVAALLEKEARLTGAPFKSVVNDALRRGFSKAHAQRKPFTITPFAMQIPPGLNCDKVESLLQEIEGEDYR